MHPELTRHERERRALLVPCRGYGNRLICHLSDLATDERSLNTSDADLAASCYAADGIFMPTALPLYLLTSEIEATLPCLG